MKRGLIEQRQQTRQRGQCEIAPGREVSDAINELVAIDRPAGGKPLERRKHCRRRGLEHSALVAATVDGWDLAQDLKGPNPSLLPPPLERPNDRRQRGSEPSRRGSFRVGRRAAQDVGDGALQRVSVAVTGHGSVEQGPDRHRAGFRQRLRRALGERMIARAQRADLRRNRTRALTCPCRRHAREARIIFDITARPGARIDDLKRQQRRERVETANPAHTPSIR
ncbi:MAG TPA: hypothetical protein VNN72_06530 [Polyangiaceae bacterium]|nr:hypothetical protein [Polyangiaceae bacterium]